MEIPACDLKRQHLELAPELERAVAGVMASGRFVLGENVCRLEEELASYVGTKYAVGVANGTEGLILALEACGVGPGDEVITTAFSFFATAGAITRLGAKPVFVDVDPLDFNLAPQEIQARITPASKAIVPVHLYGKAAPMERILPIARRYGLKVVEDAAQALGATAGGTRLGSLGDAGVVSFYPTKNLGACGDGGMVFTSDPEIAGKVRFLRAHGSLKPHRHQVVGYNSRLDEIQAALLRVKLPRLARWTTRRQDIARLYQGHLKRAGLGLPRVGDGDHVFNRYTVTSPDRDELKAFLECQGIATEIYYPLGLHQQEALAYLGYRRGDFPMTERATGEVLSLPMFPELTDHEVARVSEAVLTFTRRRLTSHGGPAGRSLV
ncbi:MAG: DegT/DnrJ/EryC1/StrS family aminotransferase [Firmicutes bacterium]|nr:DegT/DnrJ/EryC1/StrS family aminotransferase [Bacillota bacterium]